MKKICTVIIIYCTLLLPLKSQGEEVYKSFSIGRFDAYFDTTYFKTTGNFGPNGDRQSLSVNSSLQNINLQTKARYVFFNDSGLYTGLNFNNVESFNGINVRTNSQLSHFILGSDYQFYKSENWSLYVDVSYYGANVKINLSQDEALASDGADELKAVFFGNFSSDRLRSFAKIGINQRSDGLSTLMLYGLGTAYSFGYYSAFGIELNGVSSVKDDLNTNTPLVRDALTDRVNAGSRLYYSINPNALDARVYYSYAIDQNFIFKLSVGAAVLGSNSPDGNFAGASINWGFGGLGAAKVGHKKSKKFIENSNSISDEDPSFKIDTDDGVNQDLFKPVAPIKPKN